MVEKLFCSSNEANTKDQELHEEVMELISVSRENLEEVAEKLKKFIGMNSIYSDFGIYTEAGSKSINNSNRADKYLIVTGSNHQPDNRKYIIIKDKLQKTLLNIVVSNANGGSVAMIFEGACINRTKYINQICLLEIYDDRIIVYYNPILSGEHFQIIFN